MVGIAVSLGTGFALVMGVIDGVGVRLAVGVKVGVYVGVAGRGV